VGNGFISFTTTNTSKVGPVGRQGVCLSTTCSLDVKWVPGTSSMDLQGTRTFFYHQQCYLVGYDAQQSIACNVDVRKPFHFIKGFF
jgi:hypothetical protein